MRKCHKCGNPLDKVVGFFETKKGPFCLHCVEQQEDKMIEQMEAEDANEKSRRRSSLRGEG